VRPSEHPTTAPTVVVPSAGPILPSLPTESPTRARQLVENPATGTTISTRAQVSVPFDFPVTLFLRDSNDDEADESSRDIVLIWQDYLLEILTEQFGKEPGVTVRNVDLVISRPNESNSNNNNNNNNNNNINKQQQQDRVPQESQELFFVNGSAVFLIDEESVDWKDFSNRVLDDATTNDQLQQALVDAGNTTRVVAPTAAPMTNTPPPGEQSDKSTRMPTNVELVIGFTILFATILSLFYWANVLWKQRVKNIRRQQMEAVRQHSLRNALAQAAPPPWPKMMPPRLLQTLTSDDDYEMVASPHIGTPIVFPTAAGATDGESTHSSTSGGGHERATADPFALELLRAVSLDRRAWDDFRKRKQVEGERQHWNTTTEYHQATAEGVEVSTTRSSFPYGDEEARRGSGVLPAGSPFSNLSPIQETTRSVERKAPANARRKPPQAQKGNEYSPYGDRVSERMAGRKAERTGQRITGNNKNRQPLSQSWNDDEESPVADDRQPAQFSFLHPLRRRDIEADIPNATDPSSSNDDTPTSGAVRDSIDVTTVDSGLASKENDPAIEADAEKDWPTSLTETMLREVEYIAQFVRRYEQKHNKRPTPKKSRPGELYDDSGEVIDETSLKQEVAMQSPPQQESKRSALRPVANSAVLEEGRMQPSKQLPRVERSKSPLVTEEVQAGRLGIGKFTIGRPISNRSTQFDNKPSQAVLFRDQVPDLSPIQSEEEQESSPRKGPDQGDSTQYQGRLASLRSNESILDITPTGEFEPHRSMSSPEQVHDDSKAPTATTWTSHRHKPVEPIATENVTEPPRRSKKKVSPRSQNMTFNSIRSIFESKETSPIVPPNDSVRFPHRHNAITTEWTGKLTDFFHTVAIHRDSSEFGEQPGRGYC
jgi:hypothetical protein